ncbi:MAG: hypothetical protein IBX69_13700 [Anaerolineales bacterium]|nr:hypothetical protein [Anaerolineales bacterium]
MSRDHKRSKATIDQFRDFALQADSSSAIDSFLSFISRPPLYTKFRQLIIFSNRNLSQFFTEEFSNSNPQLNLVNPKASVFTLSHLIGKQNRRTLQGIIVILPTKLEKFNRIFTISFSKTWNYSIRKLVKMSYPSAMPVFFKQNEIKDALLLLEKSLGSQYRIRVSEVVMKRKRLGKETFSKKYYETDRLWTELSIDEVFERALERNQWFTSLQFNIQKKSSNQRSYQQITSGRIYKAGEVHYEYLHDEITHYVISPLQRFAAERFSLFQNRGIRDRGYKSGLPIEILFEREIFSNSAEIHRFNDVIQKFPKSTKVVFHRNPYYHASVADFLDGSSFELWVLSQNKILIIPQAKSSELAFERLVSHIFSEFREGVIREYQ